MKALIKTTKQLVKDGNPCTNTYLMGIFATEPTEHQLKCLIEEDIAEYNRNQPAFCAKMMSMTAVNGAIRSYIDGRYLQLSFSYYLIDCKTLE